LDCISAVERSLQQVGQSLEPKTRDRVAFRNSGSPKMRKHYSWTRDKNNLCRLGDGAFVVPQKREGKQSISFLAPVSGRSYSTLEGKKRNLEVSREIEPLYKELFNADLYKAASQKLRSKPGNMTPGVDGKTLDGISNEWVEGVIQKMKDRTFQFKPSTRVYILKANGKTRPLGIPTPLDKIVQQAIRIILESEFEPLFLDSSHGFRPNRSTTTAIYEVRKWNGVTWIIEGDIKGFFDNIDHHKLAELLKRRIQDKNLIDLYWKLVKAGYVNDGQYKNSFLGVPQGGVLSPLLSNIYLHEFDLFMQELMAKYSSEKGKRISRPNPIYIKLKKQITKMETGTLTPGQKSELMLLKHRFMRTSSVIRDSLTGTRIYYNRYADDWVIGVSSTLDFAKKIKQEVKDFLTKDLLLTLSEEKTKITHLETTKVQYLGFYIYRKSRKYTESLVSYVKSTGKLRRATNSSVMIEAPIDKIIDKLVEQKFAVRTTGKQVKPRGMTKFYFLPSEDIILRYNAVISGILNYYSSVENRNQLSYVMWVLKFSAVFTLARKLSLSPRQVFKKFGKAITVKFEAGKTSKSITLLYPNTLARNRTFDLGIEYRPFQSKSDVATQHS